MNRKKILIACGGSAGHIFPGLTLAREMNRCYGGEVDISFLTTDNELGRSLLGESGFRFRTLPVRGARGCSFREAAGFAYGMLKGSFMSLRLIRSEKPDCFVGFGAYAAGPPFLASLLLKVPTLIHEQNVSMGRANRIMRNFATKVALSFPEECMPVKPGTVVTGNPIRRSALKTDDKKASRRALGLEEGRFTLLATGGSQGSGRINGIVPEALERGGAAIRDSLQVIHLAGKKDMGSVNKKYESMGIIHRVFSFFNDMAVIYSAADAAVSRAGSSAIFELCARGIPTILIPYPFAGGHQIRNASYLRKRGAAIVIKESELTEERLSSSIACLMRDKENITAMKKAMAGLAVSDSAERLSLEVGRLAGLSKG